MRVVEVGVMLGLPGLLVLLQVLPVLLLLPAPLRAPRLAEPGRQLLSTLLLLLAVVEMA